MSHRLSYLPALDGLRAIAVVMVVAYHLDFSWASGGFLGVDIFFVISGYLITRLLIVEHDERGRIAVGNFLLRRFRRLVPAMVAMVAATMLATHRWGMPEQWRSIRIDALAALGYVANWRFVLDEQSYFQASLGPSPLLHTWSLAVEEQWYLLWPLVMVALCAWASRRPRLRQWMYAFVGAAALASAVWMAMLFDDADPSRVYFGTDTRAQQLLVGAALAWVVARAPSLERPVRTRWFALRSSGALVALVLLAALVHDDSVWLYRGGLLAIAGLAATLLLGTAAPHAAGLDLLAWPPLVAVGRRSYGIYLWHWPVIVFSDQATGGDLGRWQLVSVQILATLALAELSYRLVEQPARNATASPLRTIAAWTGAAVAIAMFGFFALVTPANRDLARSDAVFADLGELTRLTDPQPSGVPSGSASPNATSLPDTAQIDTRRVLLLGDSAAYTLAEQLELPSTAAWDVQAFAKLGCPITPGLTIDVDSSRPRPVDAECIDWVQLWPQYVQILEPDIVAVMVGAWEVFDHRIDGLDVRFESPTWRSVTRAALSAAVTAASTTDVPVVLLDVPCMRGAQGSMARADPRRTSALNELLAEVAADRDNVSIAPLSDAICPSGTSDLMIDGVPARYDGVHYTRAGAALVWPWLLDELDRVLDTSATALD